jgi:putative sterol carrier protein
MVAIVENPLYAVMNEPNSTLKRLIRKLNLLDIVDDAAGSGKLDIIVQTPYTIKSDTQRARAEQRKQDIEFQLTGSKYGIAYMDATEKITQLNRPAENNLLKQIELLIDMLYGQLGLTPAIMNGTADEAAMLNYNTRTINPIMTAFVEAMRRSFITKTGRSQKQSILFFRDPFINVPVSQMGDLADKLARNEVVSSNEIRQGIGMRPSKDPKADELRNSNMPAPTGSAPPTVPTTSNGGSQNGSS